MNLINLRPSGRGFREHVPLEVTSPSFVARFGTPELCRDYLFRKRWPSGFSCPDCRSHNARWEDDKPRFRCVGCSRSFSLTANTILHGTRRPLSDWFRAAFIMSQKGGNASVLERELRLTYKTAWTWARKIREAMKAKTTLDSPFPPFSESSDARLGGVTHITVGRWALKNGQFRWFADRPGGLGACCQRLMKRDWDDPQRDDPDPDERWRYALESNGVFVSTAKWWLFRAYSGSVGEKHLGVYLDDIAFRVNRRALDATERAAEVGALFLGTPRRTYRDLIGAPPDGPALRFWGPTLARRSADPSGARGPQPGRASA